MGILLEKKTTTHLPYFSVARYANTTHFFCLSLIQCSWAEQDVRAIAQEPATHPDHITFTNECTLLNFNINSVICRLGGLTRIERGYKHVSRPLRVCP